MTNSNEFQRESRRIDQLIWDAMALTRAERVLFCGYGNDGAWVRRAVEVGVDVCVIESEESRLTDLQERGVRTLRGSTTLIPARDASFDAVVAFHYLHEIDPTFHAQIVSELARVAKRVVVVEPAPPSDALGKRIAELYSRAKYEAGAFEEYQPIDYWRKLLAMVKADVLMQQFTFTRLAPRFAVDETVDLILQAMAIEEMPQGYIDELRELASRPDAQLAPLSRFVLVGIATGEPARSSAGTLFREEGQAPEELRRIAAAAVAAAAIATVAPVDDLRAAPAPPAAAAAPAVFSSPLQKAEFPPVLPPASVAAPLPAPPAAIAPPAPAPPPAAAPPTPATVAPPPAAAPALPPAPVAEPVFGLPEPTSGVPPPAKNAVPFGTPFALPDDPDPFGLTADPQQRAEYGWTWEPPEGQGEENPFGPV